MTVLDNRTLVPIGLIAVVVVAVGGLLVRLTWTSANTLTAIRGEQAENRKEMSTMRAEVVQLRSLLESAGTETWSLKDMDWWIRRANWSNPENKLPPAREE